MLKSNYYSSKMFTEYIHELMLQKKDFMVFLNNNQILVEDEVTEWNDIHGFTNETERVMYHYVYDKDETKEHYRIKHTHSITTLLIPMLSIVNNYEEFITSMKNKLGENDLDLICTCGNTTHTDGFYPCDKNGNEIEPTNNSDWDRSYICSKCSKIHTL